jgi:hypothetical protein
MGFEKNQRISLGETSSSKMYCDAALSRYYLDFGGGGQFQ